MQLIPPTKATFEEHVKSQCIKVDMVGADTAASTRAPSTNQLGLVNDWRTVYTILDQAT